MIISKNSAWFIFKTSKLEDKSIKYKLNEGDIIRFGRIITRIKEIKQNKNKYINNRYNPDIETIKQNIKGNNGIIRLSLSNNNRPNIEDVSNSQPIKKKLTVKQYLKNQRNNNDNILQCATVNFGNLSRKNKIKKICRICYMEEENKDENPLVQPCNCSGSMKYIHLKCLKQWINTRSCVKIESNEIYSTYIVKQVECELCKMKYPDFVNHKGKLYEILEIENDYESYMILESLTLDKYRNKCLYVISLDKNSKIKLGRSRDANIILNDISVSRFHCFFIIENKNIFLEDNNSKFGTLVLIQSPTIKLIESLPLIIQIGRTYFSCQIKKEHKFFACCDVFEKQNVNFYYDQNKINQRIITVKTEMDFSCNNTISEDEVKNERDKPYDDDDMLNNTRLKLTLDPNEVNEVFERKPVKFMSSNYNKISNRFIIDTPKTNRLETKNGQEDEELSEDVKSDSIEIINEDN